MMPRSRKIRRTRQPANYVCVYMADPSSPAMNDVLNDPDLDPPCPTWGICRPNIRRAIQPGKSIIFLARFPDSDELWIKGIVCVEEKLPYDKALSRFKGRRNVIVEKVGASGPHTTVFPKKWHYRKRQKLDSKKVRRMLATFTHRGVTYEHAQHDVPHHTPDNWKCGRIFLCNGRQFESCVKTGHCERESQLHDKRYANYIVGQETVHLPGRFIRWSEVAPEGLRTIPAIRGRYHARKISDQDLVAVVNRITALRSTRVVPLQGAASSVAPIPVLCSRPGSTGSR